MNTDLKLNATTLKRGQLQRIEDAKGQRVLALSGSLWLTQEGDLRDIVLEPGEMADIERDGLTILTALRDASFVLLHDDALPDWAWRVRAAQAALAVH